MSVSRASVIGTSTDWGLVNRGDRLVGVGAPVSEELWIFLLDTVSPLGVVIEETGGTAIFLHRHGWYAVSGLDEGVGEAGARMWTAVGRDGPSTYSRGKGLRWAPS